MGIKFHIAIKNRKGDDITAPASDGGVFTLGRVCEMALDTALDADKNEGLKPKLRRGRLIEQIAEAEKDFKELDLEAGDIDLIKNRIGHVFSAASIVRQACLLLDPASKDTN